MEIRIDDNKKGMRMHIFIPFIIMLMLCIGADCHSESLDRFKIGKGAFIMDNKPFVINAAELHYPRIPREYWEHRIKMSKALGMNTICLYVFWNITEPEPDKFNFEGNNDLREFVRLCQENGMYVILRPGPYVCAEWEMGGLPWWLLQEEDIRLREDDPVFMERVAKFERAVAQEVSDMTIINGGPIIMIQVENEYGSYGINKKYISEIRDILRELYPGTQLFQCDWSSNFRNNGLSDLLWTLNFGTGADIESQFDPLRKERPDTPLMCSEFWSGWFDKWGARHETRDASAMIEGLREMLEKNISFSLYMTHGGTNFGHWAGANSPGYDPDVTSYDYDAPINEWGGITPKYLQLRELMSQYKEEELSDIPESLPIVELPRFEIKEIAPMFDNLPPGVKTNEPQSMERFGQGYGSILYRTILCGDDEKSYLEIENLHDYGRVFINGKYIGKIDRRKGEKGLYIPSHVAGDTLDILVEGMGRINFGRALKDYKGMFGKVEIKKSDFTINRLSEWETFLMPDNIDFYNSEKFVDIYEIKREERVPGVYRGKFNVEKIGDTFLDMREWGKGLVYVNGHGLGRFWEIGPQQTLYLPGCWLEEGENEIVIFDIIGPKRAELAGLAYPILDDMRDSEESDIDIESITVFGDIVADTDLEKSNGWKRVDFDRIVEGSSVILEWTGETEEKGQVSIAEIYLIDENEDRVEREQWRVGSVSSQNSLQNHTSEKVFDLQESTYWQTDDSESEKHTICIDLGVNSRMKALEYLPRAERGVPESPRHVKVMIAN